VKNAYPQHIPPPGKEGEILKLHTKQIGVYYGIYASGGFLGRQQVAFSFVYCLTFLDPLYLVIPGCDIGKGLQIVPNK
jgi:hypothetical protein